MKYFLIYTVLMVLISMFLGCGTENPICSENYCVSGEIFLRSSLFEDEEFTEVAIIESEWLRLLTQVETTPQPIMPAQSSDATLSNIISDVTINGEDSKYNGETVTVTGFVVWKSDNGESVVIYKNASLVHAYEERAIFFIVSKTKGIKLDQYTSPNSYTFTVKINAILPPEGIKEFYTIGSVLSE